MRVILFLLLFLNVSAVAWYFFLSPKPERVVNLFSDDVEELRLVTERGLTVAESSSEISVVRDLKGDEPLLSTPSVEASQQEIAVIEGEAESGDLGEKTEETSLSAAVVKSCFSLGPFISLDVVKSATVKFTEKQIEVTRRELNERYLSSYQVYLPALPSLAKAKEVTQQLKQKKIRDYYIILKRGAQRYSISLGLFKDKKHALRRVRLVKRKGFKAQMLSRFRTRQLYWLDYRDSEEGDDIVFLDDKEGKGLQRLERQCN